MPKKNILVSLESFYPFENAISNAMMPIFKALQTDYNVYVYTVANDLEKKCPINASYNNFIIYRHSLKKYQEVLDKKISKLNILLEIGQYDENDKSANALRNFAKRCIILFWRQRSFSIKRKIEKAEQTRYADFEKLLKSNDFCGVITVASPFSMAENALKFAKNGYFKKNNIKWITYFVDPFSTFIEHISLPEFEEMQARELEVYKHSDLVIATPEICEDNKKYKLSEYGNKTMPMQLATFKQIKRSQDDSLFSKENINCVFGGSLFSIAIRNPEYFFNIINQLPPNFKVHIACHLSCAEVDELKIKYLQDNKNVIWHGRTQIQKCFDMFLDADVLINLGNECENQTPSKVFDYLGCSKPIINFYSIDNDTSKKYLERYPYKLNIKNKKSLDQDDVTSFINFCNENKGRDIKFEMIEKLYEDFKADKIGNQVKDIINNICKED